MYIFQAKSLIDKHEQRQLLTNQLNLEVYDFKDLMNVNELIFFHNYCISFYRRM